MLILEKGQKNTFTTIEQNSFGDVYDNENEALIHRLDNATQERSIVDISKCIESIVKSSSATLFEEAIAVLEKYLFKNKEYFLSEFLFRLYDKVENEHMARFYLQYCFENLLSKGQNTEEIYKYLSLEPKCIVGSYYNYDGDFSYEYDEHIKKYSVHSFSNDIGLNLTLLVTPYGSIIFDCGAKCAGNSQLIIEKEELIAFLGVYNVEVKDIIAVIISHSHLDHYGSISSLLGIGISSSRFYADLKTISIIKGVTSDNIVDTVRPIFSFFQSNQKVQVHSYDNGHILGSQLIVVGFDNITVVYTGDYCLHNQYTVDGLDLESLKNDQFVSRGVNCLITEATYGQSVSNILPYKEAEKALRTIIQKLLNAGYKIFLPAFAIGRSQELTMMLSNSHRILIDGLSIKLTQVYERLLEKKIANSKVKFSTENNSKIDNFEFNDIIIASSGMISQNSASAKYIEELFDSKQPVAIIRTGYLDSSEESYGYSILQKWKKSGGLLFDVSLSAHASYDELFELIEFLTPDNVVAIHGSGIVQSNKKKRINENETIPEIDVLEEPDEVLEITDDLLKQKWKNTILTGIQVLDSNESLNESQVFLTSFKILIKFIKGNIQYGKLIMEILNSFDDLMTLFSFLKSVFENDFIILRSMLNEKAVVNDNTTSIENQMPLTEPTSNEIDVPDENTKITWMPDSILYVHKGTIICQKEKHSIVAATAILTGGNDVDIELSVNYCKDCNRFFINYISYEAYKKRYGILIGNIVLEDECKSAFSDIMLAEASPLKLCGYSVNQKDALSKETRHYIITKILEKGIMSKSEIIRYLEYFININGRRKGNSIAVAKWKDDLNFTLSYRIDTQERYRISEIKRYR